jgi:formylglycine-generating enzyme required for sulfatase activity
MYSYRQFDERLPRVCGCCVGRHPSPGFFGLRIATGTPNMPWRPVHGSEVTIAIERGFLRGNKPLRKRVVDFHIARHPLTVAQYRAFIDAADGWQDPNGGAITSMATPRARATTAAAAATARPAMRVGSTPWRSATG